MDKPKDKLLPSENELCELYLSGLLRNINSILAGVYGDEVGVPATNKLRGEKSDLVLSLILRKGSCSELRKKLLDLSHQDWARQGQVPLHDLALAHVILHIAQVVHLGNAARSSSLIASSMLFGRVVGAIRKCFLAFHESFPDRFVGEVSGAEIEGALGRQATELRRQVESLLNDKHRTKQLELIREQLLSVRFLLGLFSYVAFYGLDDRSFESFLES
ncbi:MAG: hypothetical protein AAF483_09780 [Planctomycetota bacterium]